MKNGIRHGAIRKKFWLFHAGEENIESRRRTIEIIIPIHILCNCFSLAHRNNCTCHRATAKLCCSPLPLPMFTVIRCFLKLLREKSLCTHACLVHYRLLLAWHVQPEAVGLLHICAICISVQVWHLSTDGMETLSSLIRQL